jgi:hypothetical protein
MRTHEAHIVREIASLPPEARRQVMDFVAFLKTRYPPACGNEDGPRTALTDEQFIGMWLDRGEMQDSVGWVRNVRTQEWGSGA